MGACMHLLHLETLMNPHYSRWVVTGPHNARNLLSNLFRPIDLGSMPDWSNRHDWNYAGCALAWRQAAPKRNFRLILRYNLRRDTASVKLKVHIFESRINSRYRLQPQSNASLRWHRISRPTVQLNVKSAVHEIINRPELSWAMTLG